MRALVDSCPHCGAPIQLGERFCGECGAALAETSSGSAAPNVTGAVEVRVNPPDVGPELPEGESKTVTALFADIEGCMELMRNLDPEEAREIVDPALKIMVDAVRRYEGYVVQSTRDGIFALFGAYHPASDSPRLVPQRPGTVGKIDAYVAITTPTNGLSLDCYRRLDIRQTPAHL